METITEEIWEPISGNQTNSNKTHNPDLKQYSIVNNLGTKLVLSNYGASIVSCIFSNGLDVIVGDKTANNFINNLHPNFGLTTGRLAGRSSINAFTWPDDRLKTLLAEENLSSEKFQLEANENNVTHLHGGVQGLGRRIWESIKFETDDILACEFSLQSPHLDQGYPGALSLVVRIGLYKYKNIIHISYRVESDRPAPINLTNHAYFNLGDKTVREHSLAIYSDSVCEFTETAQVSGNFLHVEDTVFDFRKIKTLNDTIEELKSNTYIPCRDGIDHIWRLKNEVQNSASINDLERVASLISSAGNVMHTYTTASALVCYTGNFLPRYNQGDRVYQQHEAICLETQNLPGYLHNTNIPISFVTPTKPWTSFTEYHFEIV